MEVLLIEDSKTCAELTRYLLAHFDPQMQCETVISLQDGLMLLAQHRYDLIVFDLTLVDTQGLPSDIGKVLAVAYGTPILVYSSVSPALEPEILHNGAAAFIPKGAAPEKVLQTIGALIRGRTDSTWP